MMKHKSIKRRAGSQSNCWPGLTGWVCPIVCLFVCVCVKFVLSMISSWMHGVGVQRSDNYCYTARSAEGGGQAARGEKGHEECMRG